LDKYKSGLKYFGGEWDVRGGEEDRWQAEKAGKLAQAV
jgi:hypothetical protein